jgi:putative effector of murein hydrolase LrgA (UPF0299 family)
MPFEISIYPARHRVHILQERALYVAIAVASSLVITTAISLAIHGSVRTDYLLTAFLCSLIVSVSDDGAVSEAEPRAARCAGA